MTRLPFLLVVLLPAAAPMVAQPSTPAATFEVADVRAAAPSPAPNNSHAGALRGTRYEIRNATMLDLIGAAYDVDADKVTGGPPWLEMNRFDIAALAPPNTTRATLRTMLQRLLAHRFQLVIRDDKQQMPAFILTASAKTALKPRQVAGGQPDCEVSQRPQANGTVLQHMVCRNMNMEALGERLPLPSMAGDYIPAERSCSPPTVRK